jgi:thymidylate synthase (FAD)
MKVKLLSNTNLSVCDFAICKCYGNNPHEDLEKQKSRIDRVANVSKHSSTIEHLVYSFDIDGISRACLQELARHRIASYTVKSSRYTLQELKKEKNFKIFKEKASKYVVLTDNEVVNEAILSALENLRLCVLDIPNAKTIPNDLSKYCMPEAYKTSLVMTINARSLQNFLELRTSKHALWEIQLLAKEIYNQIPETHKFLFSKAINER